MIVFLPKTGRKQDPGLVKLAVIHRARLPVPHGGLAHPGRCVGQRSIADPCLPGAALRGAGLFLWVVREAFRYNSSRLTIRGGFLVSQPQSFSTRVSRLGHCTVLKGVGSAHIIEPIFSPPELDGGIMFVTRGPGGASPFGGAVGPAVGCHVHDDLNASNMQRHESLSTPSRGRRVRFENDKKWYRTNNCSVLTREQFFRLHRYFHQLLWFIVTDILKSRLVLRPF